jgi:N-acetylmuramoyl-L-alanine amidase
MKLFVDAGHGGKDPGATGNGLVEKTLNLAVALALEKQLQKSNIDVMLSRYVDEDISLRQRTDRANAWGADIFLSIHHNGFDDPVARGIETYYSVREGNSKQFAEVIQEALCAAFPMPDRGVKTKLGSSGRDWYHVLRESKALVAVITETGFVTSPADAALLKQPDFARREAEVLARVIKALYGQGNGSDEVKKLRAEVDELAKKVDTLYKFFGDLNKIIPLK